MENDYFSIDAILAENQKINFTFNTTIPDMGHIGGGNDRDITPSARRQIPLWLAYIVIYSNWAAFNIPTAFGARVRNALAAEATSVRLSNLVGAGGLWYGYGKVMMDILYGQQATDMSNLLRETFQKRLTEILDQAQHFATLGPVGTNAVTAGDNAQVFREGLDATERQLFILAQNSSRQVKKWYGETSKARRS